MRFELWHYVQMRSQGVDFNEFTKKQIHEVELHAALDKNLEECCPGQIPVPSGTSPEDSSVYFIIPGDY